MLFEVTITDSAKLSGITAARTQYNLDNPESPIADDAGYVQFVMDSAAGSYANQYKV